MKRVGQLVVKASLFIFFTILTQVGGIIYLLCLLIFRKFEFNNSFLKLAIFIITYSLFTFLIVPSLASYFGRERVVQLEGIKPTNYMTVILNRNYVTPRLNQVLERTVEKIEKSGIQINYLDACFPFIDRFPLLPHLSHNDGKKIDLSLVYENQDGVISKKQKSRSGYGVFEGPGLNEKDQVNFCLKKGYFQYDYPKYLTFGRINKELQFSKAGTKELIMAILQNNEVGKIFIEPHLKTRLRLGQERIRYHGCRAVRHDDHIHVQLK